MGKQATQTGKSQSKPDDKAQSERFIETARKIGADKESDAGDRLIGRLAKQVQEPRKPDKK
jgi:hypothetical protein